MTRDMRSTRRPRCVAFARVLLLVLLAVGTLGMHTLGHPAAAMASDTTAAPGGASTPSHHAPGAMPGADDVRPPQRVPHDTPHDSGRHNTGHGDQGSVCLAVLLSGGALLFTALALAALRRAAAGPSARVRLGRPGRTASGLPPPRPPLLAQLQILRI